MNKKIINSLLVVIILLVASCSSKESNILPPTPGGLLQRGTHSIKFTYAPLPDKPVMLYYHIPEDGDMRTMRILFAMHGAERDAQYQIETWKDIANDYKVMVFAPEFTSALFPANNEYQYGGVSLFSGSWMEKDKAKWTVSVIEAMFDFIKQQTNNSAAKYDIWGHSAGSQFTHRLMFFLPEARVRMAVASNSGVWIIPSLTGYGEGSYSYPHSLKGTPYTEEDLKTYFSRPLIVHLGTADLVQDSAFPTGDAAMAQGASRYARGNYFFNFAKDAAAAGSYTFNWRKVEVTGVGHNSRRMVQYPNGAAELLYGNK